MRDFRRPGWQFAFVAAFLCVLAQWVAADPPNLVANPGFEAGLRGWQVTTTPTTPGKALVTMESHSGKGALLMDASAAGWEVGAWSDPIPVQGGTRYRFGVWVKQTAGYGQYKAVLDWRDAVGKHLSYSNDWAGNNCPREYTLHGGDFAAPAAATQAVLMIGFAKGSAGLMDDFSLTALPPIGPALRAYLFCEPADAAGRRADAEGRFVRAWVRNEGDRPAGAMRATLSCPAGMTIEAATRVVPTLPSGERARLEWRVTGAPQDPAAMLSVKLGTDIPVRGDTTTTVFLTASKIVTNDRAEVPAAKPVPTKTLVGAYYFPVMLDWDRAGWGVKHVDYSTPVLGYYDEALPAVADWHIKWATEHGIGFFAYDWYYNKGATYINDALEKGFLQAKNRGAMKFCINWCNEGQCTWDEPLDFSTESLCGFMEYLCTHYLNRPEYLRVNGRPVVMIIRPDPIIEWHGGPDGSRQAIDAMRKVAREHGVGDPYMMCIGVAERAGIYRRAGYDAITSYGYGWPDAPAHANGDRDYDDLVAIHEKAWQTSRANAKAGGLGYMPVAWTGWDDNARAHLKSVKTRDNTVGRVREMLRLVSKYTDPALNMVIIEAWNEWGEGGYLEPSVQRGFSYLDAVRDVYSAARGPHTDIAPSDAQRASYQTNATFEQIDADYIKRDRARRGISFATRMEWAFTEPGAFEGWHQAMNITGLKVADGSLQGTAASEDPAIVGPALMDAKAEDWASLKVRMKTDKAGWGQLFWSPGGYAFTEEASVKFQLIPDNDWHVYELPLAANPKWRGTVQQLRFDPTEAPGATFAVSEIKGIAVK